MEDVDAVGAGDVVAVFGVECSSMDTFTDGTLNYAMSSVIHSYVEPAPRAVSLTYIIYCRCSSRIQSCRWLSSRKSLKCLQTSLKP